MELPSSFISIDWGTTNFRMRVVDTATSQIMFQLNNSKGILVLYQDFQNQNQLNQFDFFIAFLIQQLNFVPEEFRQQILVISGMASSTIGLKELDYASFPFSMSGEGLIIEKLYISGLPLILLVSGVKNQTGMMRGEEIQAIGLGNHLSQSQSGIIILPGTHCKHIFFETSQFTTMRNFMTGELFSVLTTKSILANSVNAVDLDSNTEKAFFSGLHDGVEKGATSCLLHVRTRDVVHRIAPEENYYYLSGLLIGDELSHLLGYPEKIHIGASTALFPLYKAALLEIMGDHQVVQYSADDMDQAVIQGHLKIISLYAN